MPDLSCSQTTVYGHVQGVFFRAFISRKATELGLTGYVRNLPGREAVEVRAEGKIKQLEELVNYLKVGPPSAKVGKVVTNWSKYTGSYPDFGIRY